MPASPKYLCPCFTCNSRKHLVKRTIQAHLRLNLTQLQDQIASQGAWQTISYLQSCYDQTAQLLASLAGGSLGGSQASSPSPFPGGVCLFFLCFYNNHKIACVGLDLDLDDAPIASAPLQEAYSDTNGAY